jgi:hypothetical protein
MCEGTAPGAPILLNVKRFLTLVALFGCAATSAIANPTPLPGHPVVPKVKFLKYRVAPADEYFGRLKLSILGVRNTLRDLGARADADPAHATSILGSAGLTEDAIHEWEKKYPRDTWVPTSILALERDYAKVDSDDARARTLATMTWLVHDYPTSAEGKLGKSELARGLVGVRPQPSPSPEPPAATGTPAP